MKKKRPITPALRGLPLYSVIRNGEFTCNLDKWYQCGPKGARKFQYKATIEGTELDSLPETENEKNFLIEHYGMADEIADTFGNGKWQASCEAFAGSIIKMIHDKMGGRATRIQITITPGPLADIQIEWRRGQSLPSLLAVRL